MEVAERLARLCGVVLMLSGAIWAYSNRAAVLEFAQDYLMLTRDDILMIPVGALLFVALWQSLAQLIFMPYLKLLEERDSAGPGASRLAAQLRHKAQLLTQDYEERLALTRVTEAKVRMAEIGQAQERAASMIKDAQAEALHQLETARAAVAIEIETVRKELLRQVDVLAREMSAKVTQPPAPPEILFH
mgnify:CR=1 FL=1